MNPNQQLGRNRNDNHQVNEVGLVKVGKKEMKQRISSRQDFVMIFGFERVLISQLFSTTKKIHNLAVYCSSFKR